MELTREIVENSLNEAIKIFKESNVGSVTNNVEIDYIDSEKFLSDARENTFNNLLIKAGIIKDFEKEYPGFLVVYQHNKLPIRNLLGLPYLISIDFNRAKKLLRPYNKKQIEKYFVSVFLHELTHVFETSVIEKHKEFYETVLASNYNNEEAANEILAEAVSYKYGYKNVSDKITNELYKNIYSKMKAKYNTNPSKSDLDFKSNLELF